MTTDDTDSTQLCSTCGQATEWNRILRRPLHADIDHDYSPVYGFHWPGEPWTHPEGVTPG